MGKIVHTTRIKSSPEICFDLSTSIELHKLSTSETQEEAIAGRKTGLIKLGETVTWRAKHFGIWFTLTSKVTQYERPHLFADKMIAGPFKFMHHTHEFEFDGEVTVMKDVFQFSSPLGVLGRLVDKLVLDNYLSDFLLRRNQMIKEFAESGKWKQLLEEK